MCIKIALIGAGSMGINHLRVLRDFDDEHVRLVGVADTHEVNLKRAVNRCPFAGQTRTARSRFGDRRGQSYLRLALVPARLCVSNGW